MPRGSHIGPNGLPLPRSLASLGEIRRELVNIYRLAKGGQIDPTLFGRLTHCLNTMASILKGHEFEQRLEALEERLGAANGHAAPVVARRNRHDHRRERRP